MRSVRRILAHGDLETERINLGLVWFRGGLVLCSGVCSLAGVCVGVWYSHAAVLDGNLWGSPQSPGCPDTESNTETKREKTDLRRL